MTKISLLFNNKINKIPQLIFNICIDFQPTLILTLLILFLFNVSIVNVFLESMLIKNCLKL